MNQQQQIIEWLRADPYRMQALSIARELQLNQWCLAAGFVRNLVWDKLHGYPSSTPLNDIDLVYFDEQDASEQHDLQLEEQLNHTTSALHPSFPWSVKNQARMHLRSGRWPYTSTQDAISYWVEVETAIGACLKENGDIELVAPFGLAALFSQTITLNTKNGEVDTYYQRVNSKGWQQHWPQLQLVL
ncbi:nucleotidyltransferase family protein [Yersinia enterocolitica]|uniref:nucleotidyltransferase family protein n=1 Tax=Yersinia enterocolitica TaxID=630 RepID=UPI0003D85962|nr:nucleotidyltransferase family protein [Yersinia enterocolitica]EKN3637058.1 nucleotidyltransferase family protein [Yersinia enterocolitica]EKN3689871.1 nucleotidyltransferase family protein [Yersinia enterocolitica]EKN3717313.1 nucleotidyltransferase family protein [Yersinia enterocolitica]EKN3982197.1 nucleotidyltransferase family protein [Yersinia enterocolitica]EKN3986363.1 nucleotidyltransferase family protein [Yersinia enterocolitica]